MSGDLAVGRPRVDRDVDGRVHVGFRAVVSRRLLGHVIGFWVDRVTLSED